MNRLTIKEQRDNAISRAYRRGIPVKRYVVKKIGPEMFSISGSAQATVAAKTCDEALTVFLVNNS